MALYTFYPCKADGTSETFVTFQLANDADAYIKALHVIDQHRSCTHVVVWDDERKVATRHRVTPELRSLLSRAPS